MAKLNAATRNAIPTSQFALPGERKYPIEDKAHAANAKSRATQQERAGNISKVTEALIKRKANMVLAR